MILRGVNHGERELLASCYRSSLRLADELGCRSIAFPLISTGIYGYPKREALEVAQNEVRAFLRNHDMDIKLVLYDASAVELAGDLQLRVQHYIDDIYVGAHRHHLSRQRWEMDQLYGGSFYGSDAEEDASASTGSFSISDFAMPDAPEAAPSAPAAANRPEAASPRHSMPTYGAAPAAAAPRESASRPGFKLPGSLRNRLSHLDKGFSGTLLDLIDERGLRDSEVYKRANMTRQHFSKIRSNPRYKPTKTTVLALAIALRLSLEETSLLLDRAGFSLSHADCRDVIVEFFINEGNYDVFDINEALFAYDQPLLG